MSVTSNSANLIDETANGVRAIGKHLQYLTFTVQDGEYGVDIMTVREIKGWTDTTRLPNSPTYMRGVINLRGLIIPIFDLRCRFSGELTDATPKHVVIILALHSRTIGILVDTVSDILNTNEGAIKPAPQSETQVNEKYVNGLISVEERMVVLLNVEHLFHNDQTATMLDEHTSMHSMN